MENNQHNQWESVSTLQPIPITFERDSPQSSLESQSSQTFHETFERSLKPNNKNDGSERIVLEGGKEELEEQPEELYFFYDKPYRLQRKWVLFAMTSSSFAIIGLNDSAIGALIPQMEVFYDKVNEMLLSFLI